LYRAGDKKSKLLKSFSIMSGKSNQSNSNKDKEKKVARSSTNVVRLGMIVMIVAVLLNVVYNKLYSVTIGNGMIVVLINKYIYCYFNVKHFNFR
jgi:hypothetical protein